jgi:LAO/AO transport system kinase
MGLAQRVLEGDRLALARLLTQIENETPEGLRDLSALYPHTGKAQLIGITGAPGTGKSTLVNRLALHLRHGTAESEPQRVAIIAVDPSSPFTGGAILGDRIRMQDLAGDPGVFIRSMASRGALGGLARATMGVVEALDSAGYETIVIETVGAGQAEVDIARMAHTTVVVEAPSLGDEVQAIKAGILEVADVIAVNKADLPGADSTASALRAALDLGHPARRSFRHHGQIETVEAPVAGQATWLPPVIMTVATRGDGIASLAEAINRHQQHLAQSGEHTKRDRERLRTEMEDLLREALIERFHAAQPEGGMDAALDRVASRQVSPRRAVEALMDGRPA